MRPIHTNRSFSGISILFCIFMLSSLVNISEAQAQEEPQIDASKPTNFYSYLNNALEFISRERNGNLVGYRANITYSPSERHLILGEVPLQYNI